MENKSPQKMKYDWYQSESHICISILIKNVRRENVRVDINEKTVNCTVKLEKDDDVQECSLALKLAHDFQTSSLTYKVLPSKIEIKLKKTEGIQWTSLIEEEKKEAAKKDVTKTYPSSLPQKKDWDRIASEIKKEEESTEGDINSVFQKIYSRGTDEMKKAMVKSFRESGGTVLSTNWEDVAKKKVDCRPPEGMEWRKWD